MTDDTPPDPSLPLPPPEPPPAKNLADAIRRRFAPFGGVDLELPPREPGREPPCFEGIASVVR